MDQTQNPRGLVPRNPFAWQLPPSQWDDAWPGEEDPTHETSPPPWTPLDDQLRDPMYRRPPPGSFDFDFDFNDTRTPNSWEEEADRYASRRLPPIPPPPPPAAERRLRPVSPDGWSTLHARDTVKMTEPGAPPANGKLTARNEPVNERSFLEWYPWGSATLLYQNDHGDMESIQNINVSVIEERSPVLAMAFEDSRSGPQLYLEPLSSATALPFLRFLYTGTYATSGPGGDFYEDTPTSLLLHCQLYRLGDIYELEELMTQAYVNVFRQCEFGCSSPEKPIDLCQGIRYFYQHFAKRYSAKHDRLINTVIDYCVSCFLRHRLGADEDFKKLAYELRPFHQALCKNSRERGFENEAAGAIIQLDFKPYIPETYASREDPSAQRFDDVIHHFHAHDELDLAAKKKRKRPERGGKILLPSSPAAASSSSSALPLRPRVTFADMPKTTSVVVAEKEGGLSLEIRCKRRASSTSVSSRPVPVEVSGLDAQDSRPSQDPELKEEVLHAAPEAKSSPAPVKSEIDSDSDFEIVPSPAKVEELSDNESEIVEVTHEEAKPSPISLQQSNAGDAAAPMATKTTTTHEYEDADEGWEWM